MYKGNVGEFCLNCKSIGVGECNGRYSTDAFLRTGF